MSRKSLASFEAKVFIIASASVATLFGAASIAMCARELIEGHGVASAAIMAVPGAAGAIPSGIAAAFLFFVEKAARKKFGEMTFVPEGMWLKEQPSEPSSKILPCSYEQLRLR